MAVGGNADSPHLKGMEMIFHQLEEILKKLGVEKIDAAGQPFDPDKHSAVMHIDDDNLGENTVAEGISAGLYFERQGDRFAVVKVAN